MRKMILPVVAFAMLATTASATSATTNDKELTAIAAATDDKKEQVSAEALPATVKATLATDVYKEWEITTAWHITGASEYYVVELKKGEEATTKKFDKDGKLMS